MQMRIHDHRSLRERLDDMPLQPPGMLIRG